MLPEVPEETLRLALKGDKRSLGRLISLFEDARPRAADGRRAVLAGLRRIRNPAPEATFLGFTGPPGAGKSSLLARLAPLLLDLEPESKIAVLAVDPSSAISGGSLLGDRTRAHFPPDEKRLFFRSQSAAGELGGLSPSSYQVCRLLELLFDYVLLETVGAGQNELEVRELADRVYLVLQPLGGDQIQFMKAGIMEIPDVFILNKVDQNETAQKSGYALEASLSFIRPESRSRIRLFRTSALSGLGLDDLAADMRDFRRSRADSAGSMARLEERFFVKWVLEEYGRHGLRRLLATTGSDDRLQAARIFLERSGDFDQAQIQFAK